MPDRSSCVDDYADINTRLKQVRLLDRGQCILRAGGMSVNCWCFRAGPGGSHLPCPRVPEKEEGQ